MVDPERLRNVLRRVADVVEALRVYVSMSPGDLAGDAERLGNVKYRFVTAIGGCIDAAQHVCASERWGPPEDNADAMRVLGRHDVLDADLVDTMVRVVGFRNVLVHEYRDTDDLVVARNLGHLADIDTFIERVTRLL